MKLVKTIGISLFFLILNTVSVGQISPGELTEAHAHLEGMSNCTKCHSLGAQVSNDKCLACHKEIKVRVDQRKGYHSSSKLYKKSCTLCHNEHHGRKFEIIRFDISKFDHITTGYLLEGKHKEKECRDCHKPENITDPILKKKKSTYLGLGTQCLTCHTDYHQKTLPVNCLDCHSYEAFKPAPKFDHGKSKFPLKGQHKTVDCRKCHEIKVQNGKDFQQFKGIKYNTCANCHEDIHQNQFGQNCADCHSEESFKTIKGISNFDHSRTNFNLEGRHRTVTCRSCHKGSYTAPLKHTYCYDCHTDFHKGQFSKKGTLSDCSDCHSVNGFQGSSFTIDRHNTSSFKLEGAHLATPCIACHKKNDTWSFRQIGIKCNDCHTDLHQNYLDSKYYPEANCLKCHNADTWFDVLFDHSKTEYPLTGKHRDQTCRSCHGKKAENEEINDILKFTGLTSECTQCHTDEHAGQFIENNTTDCSRCHVPDGWILTIFDHNQARFKLDGKHKYLSCNKCHPSVEGTEKPYVLYKTGKIKCEHCH